MLGCRQWSDEPKAGRGNRCRKSEALGDLEGGQCIGEPDKVRRCRAVEDLVYEDGNLGPDAFRNAQPMKAAGQKCRSASQYKVLGYQPQLLYLPHQPFGNS